MDLKGRQQRLQNTLSAHRLDALLVTHLPNVSYLCGFTGSAGVMLVTRVGSVFFTDGRYTAQARAEVKAAKIVIAAKAPLATAAEWLAAHRTSGRRGYPFKAGIEGAHLTVTARSQLAGILGSGFRLPDAPLLVEQARMVKDKDELGCIRSAVILGSSLFERALEVIRPGVGETEV